MNILGKSLHNPSAPIPSLPTAGLANDLFPDFSSETIDGLRHLITRLNQRDHLPHRLAIVSAQRHEGVSYIAKALAATMSHDLERRICLVDMNYWWPGSLPKNIDSTRSLGHVLTGQTILDDALIQTNLPNLTVLPAGEVAHGNRSKIANSMIIRDIIEELSYRFDHLIIDVPAILSTPDAVALASLSDSACLVIRQGVTNTEDVSRALDEIEHLNLVGVVLNRFHLSTPAWLVKMLAL